MLKKIQFFLAYILKEIFVKYLLCYILAIVTFVTPCFFTLPQKGEDWLISLSVSLISVPLVFVIYTLYNNALNRKSQIKVFI